ncbi:MAG: hypothetical protein OEV94_09760 [Deltaproteobacteria bacterium]|nr:hypothetical protein [Deltaproteobacteria bacterium]
MAIDAKVDLKKARMTWAMLVGTMTISYLAAKFMGHGSTVSTVVFSIMVVQWLILASQFLHLNVEPKFVWGLWISSVFFVAVLFILSYFDVWNHQGINWCRGAADCVQLNEPKSF